MQKEKVHLLLLPLFASVFCLLSFLFTWQDKAPVIRGDGIGYYSYLPALIIYQDLSFSFYPEQEEKYYPEPSLKKDFMNKAGEGEVNKYFSGASILWLPFFLLAHLISLITAFPADGYSLPYQFLTGSAASLWLFVGSRWMIGFLRLKGIPLEIGALSTLLFIFGSNLFHYTVYDPTLTHALSFTLFAGFLYYFSLSAREGKTRMYVLSAFLFGLIIALRPQNVLLLFPGLILSAGSFARLKSLLFSKKIILSGLAGMLPIFFQLLLWKKQSGNWLVDSYPGEEFDFSNPEILNMLFSFEKGWFVYTPLVFIAGLGLIPFTRKNPLTGSAIALFLAVSVYLFSCWWIWTYGHSFGQRIFVEYYPIFIFLLAHGITILPKKPLYFFLPFLILFVPLNLFQSWQHFHGIRPTLGTDRETYFESFFSIRKTATFNPSDDAVEEDTEEWISPLPAGTPYSDDNPFGNVIRVAVNEKHILKISVEAYCSKNCSESRIVAEGLRQGTQTAYQAFFLKEFLSDDAAVLSFSWSPPAGSDSVSVYLWNPGGDEIFLKKLSLTKYLAGRQALYER